MTEKSMQSNQPKSDGQFHILHVLGSLGVGGAQRSVLNLISRWSDDAFRHSVVCILSDRGQFRDQFREAGIPVHHCPLLWSAFYWIPSYRLGKWLRAHTSWTFPFRFAELVSRLQADVVHTHLSAHIYLQTNGVLRKCRRPFVWTIHGLYRSRGEASPDWAKAVELIRTSPRAVITGVSRAALQDGIGGVDFPNGKARVIYNSIDLGQFGKPGNSRENLRTLWGIPADAVVYGSAGRLIPIKRFDLLIRAFADVASADGRAHLVIAGEGFLYQDLMHLSNELGVGGRVHLVGYQADIAQFWPSVDVGILSSDSEGLGMALLEACASGVPCIGTRVGGIPEVIKDGAGILAEPGNSGALAEAMKQMLNPSARSQMGRRARAVAGQFSIERAVSQYATVYRELLENRA